MLSREDLVEVFTEVLGRAPQSKSWIDEALKMHSSRESLVTELKASEEFRTKTAVWSFERLFADVGIQSDQPAKRIPSPALICKQIKAIQDLQGDYQPIYGLGREYEESPRLNNLLFDCNQVEHHFKHVKNKGQIRVLDVGCNLGYLTFKLSELGFSAAGIDINRKNIDICHLLRLYAGSKARFDVLDILDQAEHGDLDWTNLDCALLLNVVHQFIFARGLEYTRTLLSRIAKRVDVLFVELALKQDYVSHGKDHLLPEDPRDVLPAGLDYEIKLLKREGRPFYKIVRTHMTFGAVSMFVEKTQYSENPLPIMSRKYYTGFGRFLKCFRFTPQHGRHAYDRELRGLLAMKGSGLAPDVFDWVVNPSFAMILMEEIGGVPLTKVYKEFFEPERLVALVAQYIMISAWLAKARLYHNDLAAHNLRVLGDGSLYAIDFEQSDTRAFIDPFAVLLWTIYDVLMDDKISYKTSVYERLYNPNRIHRADREYYPDFSKLKLTGPLRELIERAETSPAWFSFLEDELNILSMQFSSVGYPSGHSNRATTATRNQLTVKREN